MTGVSVVICCYNSRLRLPETLKHLARQETTFPWEIIVVNNASSDNTAEVALEEWSKYRREDVQFRIVREPKSGLSFAREKGMLAALSEVIILCDDDNYLMERYIQHAYELLQNPAIGLAGGEITPLYEIFPPHWFHKYAHYLALGKQASREGDITITPGILFGAGMVIRRSAYLKLKHAGFLPILSDRKKGKLLSGGDTELCIALRLMGYRLHYSEGLQMKHYIPSSRISWDYLKLLLYAMGQSSIYFIAYYEHIMPEAERVPRGFKKGWLWQYLSTFKEFLKRTPGAIGTVLKRNSESQTILDYLFLKGRLSEILILRTGVNYYYQQVDTFVRRISDAKNDLPSAGR